MRTARRVLRRGYTLAELIIVIGILGLAGALVVPSLVDSSTFAAQSAVRTFIADTTFAQSDALANQGFRRIQFIEDEENPGTYLGYALVRVTADTFTLPFDEATADWVQDPLKSPTADRRYMVDFTADDRFAGVRITDVDIDDGLDLVTFDEFGGTVTEGGSAPGTGGTVTFATDEFTFQVSIAAFTGKLTVQEIED